MRFPQLEDWVPTCNSLHRAAQVLGSISKTLLPRQPNALHLSLEVVPQGIATRKLPDSSRIVLNFVDRAVDYHHKDGAIGRVMLNDTTPYMLMVGLVSEMATVPELTGLLDSSQENNQPLSVNLDQAANFARVLNAIHDVFMDFRSTISEGAMTPLVVWPHHFDLSFLWFPGGSPDEESQPHMNFGFAPLGDEPYVYVYGWPMPEDFRDIALPAHVHWNTAGWVGAVLPYSALVQTDDPEGQISTMLRTLHQDIGGRLR
jgi:hypothetical protein